MVRQTNDYGEFLETALTPPEHLAPLVLDLFAGAGGLALGFEAAGFDTAGMEADEDCVSTYNRNLRGRCEQEFLTPHSSYPDAPVIIGGPPCQPFSVGGRQSGTSDRRNGVPSFVAAVKKVRPEIFLLENVRGLLYRNKWYLDQVAGDLRALGYMVEIRLISAVGFRVAQRRERIVLVGHRGQFEFPASDSEIVTAGEALGRMATDAPADAKYLTPSMDAYVARYERASQVKNPRDLHMGRPSRTLTTRNLAGATGDMLRIRLPDGRRRMLTPREGARLQSFPDRFEFVGAESSKFRQIGNAVPPLMAKALALSVRAYLNASVRHSPAEIEEMNTLGQLALFD